MNRASAWPRLMVNTIRRYDWGSAHVLAHLQGRDPHGHPEAELWMGAHPMSPSVLLDVDGREVSLLEAIEEDCLGTLGPVCLERFGPRLPFLLKVLAVAKPLSVQVHPSPEQARVGFAREEAAGVPRDAAGRVYVDAFAKPEMLFAVTAFEALAGLREPHEAGYLVDLLDAPRLGAVRRLLGGGRDVVAALELLVAWPHPDRAALVAEIVHGASRSLGSLHATGRTAMVGHADPDGPGQLGRDRIRRALEWVLRIGEDFPVDPLAVGPLLLQLHELTPGETVFVPAGVPHAYLDGVGVEIMSSSDNVVRAGLTSKHVDAEALLELLDAGAAPVVGVPYERTADGETVYRPPVEEFQLGHLLLDEPTTATEVTGSHGPQVLLCLTGEVQISTGEHHMQLTGGQSAFIGADVPSATITGKGEVFRATVASLD